MTFALTAEQQEISTAVSHLCTGFGDEYWLARDGDSSFPHEFHRAIAEAGWLGIAMSEAYRGSGLGRPLAASRQVAAQPVTVDTRFTHDAFASSSIPYRNNDAMLTDRRLGSVRRVRLSPIASVEARGSREAALRRARSIAGSISARAICGPRMRPSRVLHGRLSSPAWTSPPIPAGVDDARQRRSS